MLNEPNTVKKEAIELFSNPVRFKSRNGQVATQDAEVFAKLDLTAKCYMIGALLATVVPENPIKIETIEVICAGGVAFFRHV